MAYSDFKTLEQINEKLGIVINEANNIYSNIEPVEVSQWFIETMKRAYTKAVTIGTEVARQALIVDQVLIELEGHVPISFFLGTTFNVDSSKDLTGAPDALISKSHNQLYIISPVIVGLVEAKKGDLAEALPQCIAEMEAARIFNDRKNNSIPTVYGVVTNGELWQFISLMDNTATIDVCSYTFGDGGKIIGILKSFI
jgi:hypothetical protein